MLQHLSHPLLRSLINIQLVDIADTDHVYRNSQRFGKHLVIKLFTLRYRKLLGIIQAADKYLLRQNNGRNHQRSSQRSAPGFVDTGNIPRPLSIIFTFISQHCSKTFLLQMQLFLFFIISGQQLLHTAALVSSKLCQLVPVRCASQ